MIWTTGLSTPAFLASEVELRADSRVPRLNDRCRSQPRGTRRRERLRLGRREIVVHRVIDVDADLSSRSSVPEDLCDTEVEDVLPLGIECIWRKQVDCDVSVGE